MTYAILNTVYDWCITQFDANNSKLKATGEATASMEYLEAIAELATAIKKVMQFN